MESDINRPININNYNSAEGKLCASIKWIITRIYESNDVPDILQDLFLRDKQGNLQLREAVSQCLSSGTFYTQAASKILRHSSLVTQSVGAVLRALSSAGIEAREADGSHITEASLTVDNPLKIHSHLALIDALMMAHLKSVISIERVVQAVSAYTPVEKREEPLDCVDALLFWINKICLLVRDDVERNEVLLESSSFGRNGADATIPEMEDLYEDLCDGTCVCVLVSFYHSDEVPLQKISFNDPMHINDCRFNLSILKKFCETALPFNPFHFEIDDILYLHESLQPNVNVFLADLFHFFEGSINSSSDVANLQQNSTFQQQHHSDHRQQQQLISPTQRRFVPITAGIPNLRASNMPANNGEMISGGFQQSSAAKLNRTGHGGSQRDRGISMASMDSLMTNRSGDSLNFPRMKQMPNFGPDTTNFGEIQDRRVDHSNVYNQNDSATGSNIISNDNANTSRFSATEAKLQMGELRRQWEANKIIQNAANEEKRNQASKDAFFRVMSKSTNDDHHQISESARENLSTSGSSRQDVLSAQLNSLQEQINDIKLNPNRSADYTNDQINNNSGALNLDHHNTSYGTPSASFSSNTIPQNFPRQKHSMEQSPYALPHSNQFPSANNAPNYVLQQQQGAYQNMDLHHQLYSPYPNSPHVMSQNNFTPSAITGSPSMNFHVQQSSLSQPSGLNTMISPYSHQSQQMSMQQQTHNPSGFFTSQMQHYGNHPQQTYFASGQPQQTHSYQQYPAQLSHISAPSPHPMHPQQQPMGQFAAQQQPHQYMQPIISQSFSSQQHLQFLPNAQLDSITSPASAMPQQQQYSLQQQQNLPYAQRQGSTVDLYGVNSLQQRNNSVISPSLMPSLQQTIHDGQSNDSTETFRLHQPNASTSRLDPPLELNRNLTNWGLTYRLGERPQRKGWTHNTFQNESESSATNTCAPITPTSNTINAGGDYSSGDRSINNTHQYVSGSSYTAFDPNDHAVGGSSENSMTTSSNSAVIGRRNGNDHEETRRSHRSGVLVESQPKSSPSDVRRPMSAFIAESNVEDNLNPEMTAEMQAKRRALLLNQMRRKEKIVSQNEEKEQEISERRQQEQQKLEQAEQRKLERELKRQRLLEDYKRKKVEQELGELSSSTSAGGSASARMFASSTSLNRGHSQPPIGRPKSQINMSPAVSKTLQRPGRTHSNVASNDNENSTPRVSVASVAEPTLKLYAKHQPKSNRSLMMNALQYRVFPGAVSAEQKSRVQCALAQSDSKHFLVLFRDHKCQYRGMYTWDQLSDTVYKIDGTGPKICREDAMVLMFKYDSGAKHFSKIPTKHLSATIDGFTIDEQFWQRTKIPHS